MADGTTRTDTPTELSSVREALERRFDGTMIQRRKIGGGRDVPYVSGSAVISRLNAATGDRGWSLHVVERWKETLDVNRWNEQTRQMELVERDCLCILAELTVPGLGTRTGIGVQVLEPGGGEDPIKGALTDATKNCAKSFGVALELYGLTEETPGGQSDTESIPENPGYQRAAPSGGGGQRNGPMEPTDKQRKLIEVLRDQLNLSAAELDGICKDATGYGTEGMGRKTASSLIDKLQELKEQGHRGSGANPTPNPAAGAGKNPPPSGGTAGTGGTPDDVTVRRWVKTIEDARTPTQIRQMQATLKEAGLIDNELIAQAITASAERFTTGSEPGDSIPF